jgi:hypothetical protein
MVQAAAARCHRDSRRDAGATVQEPECCWCFGGVNSAGPLEKIQGGAVFAFYLREGALAGRFFGTPAQELGSVAEAASGEVIELDFDD